MEDKVSHKIFQNKIQMKNFTYEYREGLDEETVKQAVTSPTYPLTATDF